MGIAKNHVYAVLAAVALIAAYVAWSIGWPPTLEFRERAYPQGFLELVLGGAATRLDPSFGLQPLPRAGPAAKPSLREVCDALYRDPGDPALGDRESPVQIVEFFDYRCPYCKTLANILAAVRDERMRIVYKEWPILGASSVLAARAALAADRQGKYHAFHMRLMNSRFIPTAKLIEDMAAELGMNPAQLRSDMQSSAVTRVIERTSALASALGFFGTPVLVVGRTVAQCDIARPKLERLIEVERQAQRKAC